MLKNSLFNIFFLSISFLPLFSFGQSVPATTSIPELEEQIYVNVSNEFPQPLEEVTISLEAYGTDLNKANISWSVNGAVIQSGVGEKNFTLKAGTLGVTKRINLTISPQVGSPINKTIVISPQEIDLVWEALTYTPPFYKGKALFAPQESVVVVAMPNFVSTNGAKINPSNLIYKWRKDGEVEQDQSGYGKNVYKTKGDILLKENNIEVEVTGTGKERGKESVDLKISFPEAVFYENNPLYGILFNKSLVGGFFFSDEEKNIEAFPYYFGVARKSDPRLSYEWRVNSNKINIPNNTNSMVFRNTEKESGTSLVGVTITNSANFLEEARGNVNLNYSAPRNNIGF